VGNEHIFTHILFSFLDSFLELPFYVLLPIDLLLTATPPFRLLFSWRGLAITVETLPFLFPFRIVLKLCSAAAVDPPFCVMINAASNAVSKRCIRTALVVRVTSSPALIDSGKAKNRLLYFGAMHLSAEVEACALAKNFSCGSESLEVHSPQLAAFSQRPIRSPSFPHVLSGNPGQSGSIWTPD
jgi:hypothetical protein